MALETLKDLKEIKIKTSNAKVCYNITKGDFLNLNQFTQLGKQIKLSLEIDMISLRSSLITKEFIDICHFNNILALSWDFLEYKNPIDKIRSLIDDQIDGILFDNHENIPIIKNMYKKLN